MEPMRWETSPSFLVRISCAMGDRGLNLTLHSDFFFHRAPQTTTGDPESELANVDVWFGNAHKWLMAPKSAAVLYVRKDHHTSSYWPEPTVLLCCVPVVTA